ncbi:MAG: hypothetical protein FWF41_07250 [Betaproteobacteria bacterium]|nr:hypothetical protein [Betaproteobacteria bacterium]
MKSFFNRKYYLALAVLLVSGCVATSESAEQGETPPVAVTEAPSSAQPSEESLAAAREAAAAQDMKLLTQRLSEFQKLLDDLARYPRLSTEEIKASQTELNNSISAAGQSGGNGNRIRLAYLLSLQPGGVNDQRAITLLDTVAKNEKTPPTLRHLASVLQLQIQEKQRAMQKLEALRDVDRQLLAGQLPDAPKTPPKKTTSNKAASK